MHKKTRNHHEVKAIKAQEAYSIMRQNPEQYEELDKLEAETGYTMSIQGVRVRDIVKKG